MKNKDSATLKHISLNWLYETHEMFYFDIFQTEYWIFSIRPTFLFVLKFPLIIVNNIRNIKKRKEKF